VVAFRIRTQLPLCIAFTLVVLQRVLSPSHNIINRFNLGFKEGERSQKRALSFFVFCLILIFSRSGVPALSGELGAV